MFSSSHSRNTFWSEIHSRTVLFSSSKTSKISQTLSLISFLFTVAALTSNFRTRYVFFLLICPQTLSNFLQFLFRPNDITIIIPFPRPVIHLTTLTIEQHYHSRQTSSSLSPAFSVKLSDTVSVSNSFNHRSTWATKARTFLSDPFHCSLKLFPLIPTTITLTFRVLQLLALGSRNINFVSFPTNPISLACHSVTVKSFPRTIW